MRYVLSLLVLTLTAISIGVAQRPDGLAKPQQLCELYSWRQSNGIWAFRLLPSPSGVNIPASVGFDKKFLLSGVAELKRKISDLQGGAKLLWMDRLALGENPNAQGNAILTYPPARIIEQVKRYAQKRGIEVEIVSANPFKSS